jgi:hypothetical protein
MRGRGPYIKTHTIRRRAYRQAGIGAPRQKGKAVLANDTV